MAATKSVLTEWNDKSRLNVILAPGMSTLYVRSILHWQSIEYAMLKMFKQQTYEKRRKNIKLIGFFGIYHVLDIKFKIMEAQKK